MNHKTYTLNDFNKSNDSTLISKDGKYALMVDKGGYYYPLYWFYRDKNHNPKQTHIQNFLTSMVNTSTEYSFSFAKCLEMLNKTLQQ
jgi:hypothetical protein